MSSSGFIPRLPSKVTRTRSRSNCLPKIEYQDWLLAWLTVPATARPVRSRRMRRSVRTAMAKSERRAHTGVSEWISSSMA